MNQRNIHKSMTLLVIIAVTGLILLFGTACSSPTQATNTTPSVGMPTTIANVSSASPGGTSIAVSTNSPPIIPTTPVITRTTVPTGAPRTVPTTSAAKPNSLVLTHAQPSASASGQLTAPGYGKQNYNIFLIDVTDFQTGGTLVIKVMLGEGESDGSFDLFSQNVTPPIEGRAKDSIATLYDLKSGKSGTLSYKFTSGQVFQFGATGNWFSRENSTNTFTFTVTIEASNASSSAAIPATTLLTQRPFRPTDTTLFFPSVYSSTLALVDATGPIPTEDQARKTLEDYLRVQYPNNAKRIQEGIALYNNRETFLKIPSPTLRAAFVALQDTLGEPSIDFILHAKTSKGNPKVALVRFSKFASNRSNTIAMVNVEANPDDPEQMIIEVNERFQAESPFLFTNSLAHESLHNDRTNSIVEEEALSAFDTLIYLEQLARHPELARSGTWLSRWMNTNALSRLNSGSGAKLGLFDSNNKQPVWPASSKDTLSFDQRFTDNPGRDSITPGNILLEQYLQRSVEKGHTLPAKIEFSPALLQWISDNQAEVSPEDLIAAAKALKLDIPTSSR